MKKNIIWTSEFNVKDYKDYLEEEYPEITDEYKKYELVYDLNNDYLGDERMNLDIQLSESIICIGSLGLWNGRKSGYKIIESGNISDCLYEENRDSRTWFCNAYNLHFVGSHHDGTNYYLYRVWKDGLTDIQKENFLNKIYKNRLTKKDITRYTKSLRPYIQKVYGF